MKYKIKEVKNKEDYESFMLLPFELYRGNKYWVAPIKKDYIKYIQGEHNDLGQCPHKLYLAYKEDSVVGRIMVYIDEEINRIHNIKCGYISEYEAIEDQEVANLLLDKAKEYFLSHNMEVIRGPVSLPSGEDHRGFIIDNFQIVPKIMNTYNFPYYNDQWITYGFEKYHDCYAFSATANDLRKKIDHLEKILPRVLDRYHFHVDTVDLKNRQAEDLEDIYQILKEGLPPEWEDFKPVTREEVQGIFAQVKPFVDEELVCIARTNEGRPIGFNLALPDYNEILREFNGKLGPFQILKFLFKKRKIKGIRMFVMFVVPEYQKKGVSAAIYYTCFKNGVNKGYNELEGSTIWDYNEPMLADIRKFGAKENITYRLYKKELV
ncbi:MAG: GNAT family N-acetyltransferase [Tissierellia bacterium]|nr:GNAT family N-acetyltransferase [Tissierellia bacterium]